MHIAEGFLPPAHAVAWGVASAPFVVHGARSLIREVREHPESTLLLGASGAFTFVLSALKLPSVTGSCSHPTGTGLGAILFRPPVMAVLGTITLLFQALLLAHGGLTTLGANVFSMAVVGPWAGYGVYRLLRRYDGPLMVAVFSGAFVADLSTYCVTSVQLALAFPDPGLDWDSPASLRTLALSIIGNLITPHLPMHVVNSFVERFLADAPHNGWLITFDEIERWKAEHSDWVEEARRRLAGEPRCAATVAVIDRQGAAR